MDQEFLHAFIDGAEPGWDASVRYDAHEKVRRLFEQLGTAQDALRHLVLMDDDSSDVSVIARTGLGESYPAKERSDAGS